MMAKKTLEINPHHSVMKELLAKVKDSVDDKLDDATEDLARLMFQMAMLNSGFNIDEPSDFTQPLQKLINVGFGLKRDEPVEEIEIEIEEEEEEPENEDAEINPDDLEVEEIQPEKEDDDEPSDAHKKDDL